MAYPTYPFRIAGDILLSIPSYGLWPHTRFNALFKFIARCIHMVDAIQAQAIVIQYCESGSPLPSAEKFAIQSCEFSKQGNCWVVYANSEDYVLHGRDEHCYIGVNAYLVDQESGSIEIVGSGQSVEQYLQDKEDLRNAGHCSYVLEPAFDKTDKSQLIHFRQALECSLQFALQMVSPENRGWLTGKLSALRDAQANLEKRGIPTRINLLPSAGGATEINPQVRHWDALKAVLKSKEDSLT